MPRTLKDGRKTVKVRKCPLKPMRDKQNDIQRTHEHKPTVLGAYQLRQSILVQDSPEKESRVFSSVVQVDSSPKLD